jgi:hypothetical protein
MKRFSLAAIAVLFALCVFRIPSAPAALWLVTAERPKAGGEPFSFKIEDSERDDGTYATIGDLKWFSGVSLTESSGLTYYPTLSGLPNLTINGLVLRGESPGDSHWDFISEAGKSDKRPEPFWGYYSATLVPIPSAVLLLGSGLIGFIGLRKRLGRR